ncbi:MAG: hypothetical protein WBB35_13995, partial [Saprospiraceae bacterium]
MAHKRRKFLKWSGLAGLGLTGMSLSKGLAMSTNNFRTSNPITMKDILSMQENNSLIGQYGSWAASLHKDKLPVFS